MTDHLTANFGAKRPMWSGLQPSLNCAESITRCFTLVPELRDWIDLLAALDASGIRYLIVGGIAVSYHSVPRFTKDLDVLVQVKAPDHLKLYECLQKFGAPIQILRPEEFLQDDFVFHFGIPPWRIDVLTSAPGINFDEAYASRVSLPLGDFNASCISKEWLIKAKAASGRPQDLIDLQNLKQA